MIAFEEARDRVLDSVGRLGSARVPLDAALGLVGASDVVSRIDVPSFDNSAMDGYAVRAADLAELPCRLPVVVTSVAGHPGERPISAGEAARILTGAVLVDGADTVVPVEMTDAGTEVVEIVGASAAGAHIRRAGDDTRAGDLILGAGTRVEPAHLGLLASCGIDRLEVVSAPEVAVVVTGDELVEPPAPLEPGQIYESNGRVLGALVEYATAGRASVRVERVGDDADELGERLDVLGSECDLIITSGGVSMGGEYDVVKVALESAGVEFWQVAIKPAKPMAFGCLGRAKLVGVPGNPVSAQVSFELFVRPLLRKQMGIDPVVVPPRVVVAAERLTRGDDAKTHFLRVAFDASGRAFPSGKQFSHVQSAMATADALAVIPPDRLSVEADEGVEVIDLVRAI